MFRHWPHPVAALRFNKLVHGNGNSMIPLAQAKREKLKFFESKARKIANFSKL